ncbi:MAG: glycosyltransferase family 4 protein [Verrucomicrobiales bacterium]
MDKIAHLLYSGVGGQAGVVLSLAKAGPECAHHAGFYGVEPAAPQNIAACEAQGIGWRAFRKKPGFDGSAQRAMAKWLAELQPAAAVVHTPAALIAARRARRRCPGMKIIAVEHHSNALKTRKQWALSAAAFWLADDVVYLTEAYRDEVKAKLGALFRSAKASVIPNGLDLAAYPAAAGNPLAFTIGMQGRMVDGKDFASLIRAFASLKAQLPGWPLRLELAGDGPRRDGFETLANELGVDPDVTFLGMVPHAELIRRMACWNAFALSSDGETMSMALMEAFACGLPCAASNAPGLRDFIRHGENGLLFKAGDPASIAAALRAIATNPALRARLSQNARAEAAASFSASRMWAGYRSLIAARPQPAMVTLRPHHA